jgi:hypothetical protein
MAVCHTIHQQGIVTGALLAVFFGHQTAHLDQLGVRFDDQKNAGLYC